MGASELMMTITLLYIAAVSVVGFVLMGLDKRYAIRGAWRISEAVLLFIALVGGAAGVLLGMLVFRHKIRKAKFFLLVPLLIAAHIWALTLLV